MRTNADELLLFQLSKGSEQAFSKLYDTYWEGLFLYVMGILGEENEAEDVVQDVFITLWRIKTQLTHVRVLRSYLMSMARNKAVKQLFRHKSRVEYLDDFGDFADKYEQSAEQKLITNELSGYIDREIANLPAKMQEVFILSRKEGLSNKEIAKRLSISPHTVKKQINNSIKQIRGRLGYLTFILLIISVLCFS